MIIKGKTFTSDESSPGREGRVHVGEVHRFGWDSLQKLEAITVVNAVKLD